jgi:hypothetical protein
VPGLAVRKADETPTPKQRDAADHKHGEPDRAGFRQNAHPRVPNFAAPSLVMLHYSIALTLALRLVHFEQLF